MNRIKIAVTVAAVILAAGVFMLVRAGQSSNGQEAQKTQPTAHTFSIALVDGKMSDGESTLKVRQNDSVTIKVYSNTKDELHLHGYDKSFELEPSKSREVTFKATKSGRFEAELHSNEAVIFALEVLPE